MRKKMLISIALVFIMILNCFLPFTNVRAYEDSDNDVEITLNGNLYVAVKRALTEENIIATYNDAQRTISISQSEIDRVTRLNLSNGDIDDLKGLEIFKNVTYVDLSANKLTHESSLEALSGMPLTYLDLSSNEIEDVSAITNLDSIIDVNLHNQKFQKVEIITLTDVNETYEDASEVTASYLTQLPEIVSHAGILKSDWLKEEKYGDPNLRIDWSAFNPAALDIKLVTGSESGAYEGMIKLSIKVTDPENELYNSQIDVFFITMNGDKRGIIFKDQKLYDAVKAQIEKN